MPALSVEDAHLFASCNVFKGLCDGILFYLWHDVVNGKYCLSDWHAP